MQEGSRVSLTNVGLASRAKRPRRGTPRPSAAFCFAPGQEGFETGSDESIPEPRIRSYSMARDRARFLAPCAV
jgi:hypothetical protein